MELTTVFIKQDYFLERPHFKKMLDHNYPKKQSQRSYLFLKIKYEENDVFVPLRSRIEPVKKFGIIGYRVPSNEKPQAGLDYRHILIINDVDYIEFPTAPKITRQQLNTLKRDYIEIEKQVIAYLNGYTTAAVKNRIEREPKYRLSCLVNFDKELRIAEKRKARELEIAEKRKAKELKV